jgi:hypothetical protein
MSQDENKTLLQQLADNSSDGNKDAWKAVQATPPAHQESPGNGDEKLTHLLDRINRLANGPSSATGSQPTSAPVVDSDPEVLADGEFVPLEPRSIEEAQLTESEVEAWIMKFMLARGDAAGREVAEQVKLPFVIIDEMLRRLKYEQLLIYRDSAPMNDYVYQLTELGRERGKRLAEQCTFFGAAPVSLDAYTRLPPRVVVCLFP